MEDLPDLNTARYAHACAYFVNADNDLVKSSFGFMYHTLTNPYLRYTWWLGASPSRARPCPPPPC